MDGFEIRLQLVSILRKLSSSQNSIQSTIRFLLKYKNKYGEDLWDCLIEEAEKVNLNARINLLYLIDGLLFNSSTALLTSEQTRDYEIIKTSTSQEKEQEIKTTTEKTSPKRNQEEKNVKEFNYGYLIKKDIIKLIEIVVPINFKKKGLLNLMSTQQVLKNWKSQINLIDQFLNLNDLNQIDQILINRKTILAQAEIDPNDLDNDLLDFSKKDILGRIDDDRERHKRLRERMWALPIPPTNSLITKLNKSINHPLSSYLIHRSTTLLHTTLISISSNHSNSNANSNSKQFIIPHLQSDLTISLECDQLIHSNLEDTNGAGLEDSDLIAIKFENFRCFGYLSGLN